MLFAAGTSNEVLESVIGMGYDLASEPPVRAAVVEDVLRADFDALSAITQIVRMIERRGVLIMSGIAWDLLDSATADWVFLQRRALAAAGGAEAHRTLDGFRFWWRNELFADVPAPSRAPLGVANLSLSRSGAFRVEGPRRPPTSLSSEAPVATQQFGSATH